MKICKSSALRLWGEYYGNVRFAKDFHGNLMCRDGYGDKDYYTYQYGQQIYCGWNIHHILPVANGGTNEKHNLICTNIYIPNNGNFIMETVNFQNMNFISECMPLSLGSDMPQTCTLSSRKFMGLCTAMPSWTTRCIL